MSFPENIKIPFDELVDGVNIKVGTTTPVDLRQMSEKGFDYTHGAGVGFVATLQGSVRGQNWTNVANLNANAQGAFLAHYNYARINCTVLGAYGTGTELYVSGKVL